MKAIRRFALLLAPVGAALLAQPAAAQVFVQAPIPARVAVAPAHIDRFDLQAAGPLEPGRQVRFRLVGDRGARASLDIPGVARDVAMAETRPGVYEATYVIRLRDDPRAFERAVATLQRGGTRDVARVDFRGERHARRDARPPQVSDFT